MWKKALIFFFFLLVFAFTALMFTKISPYFTSFSKELNFLSTKPIGLLTNETFFWGFYTHITSSLWVLALGMIQFIPYIFRTYPTVHQLVGKIYCISILALAAPSGLVLAYYANGGLPAQVGFSFQCVIWWLSTYQAWQEALRKNWIKHIEMMLISYAVTLAAMSLRGESYLLFYLFHTKPIETYLTVTWFSWTFNIFVAKLLIMNHLPKKLLEAYRLK